ncbi:MAG: ABC transporter permease [Acidimicrobiia bacterium]|nr:ABC transporter permease [Acidimicrobiia bacterium]
MTVVGLRIARLLLVALIVSFFTFVLLDASPADQAVQQAGFGATPEVVDQIRDDLGLDDGYLVRYGRWLGDVVQGDLGESVVSGRSATSLIRSALPKTIELMVLAQIMALGISIPTAIHAAQRPGGLADRISSGLAFGFLALPAFVLGIYLTFVFAVKWDLLPAVATDIPGLDEDPLENLRQMFLPSLVLALNLVAVYLRLLRSDLIDTMQQDYVLLARARGYTRRRVLWRHAFRPSSLSLVTAIGLNTAGLIGGALIVEFLFAIPGMGRLAITSVFSEDYAVVQATVLVLTLGFVLINFVVDLAYAVIDPRIRHGAR